MPSNSSQWVKTAISVAGAATAGPVGAIVARLAGSMLEVSLPGMSVFLSSIAGNLASSALQGLSGKITSRLTIPEKLHINHDLQSGFMDACCEALYDIGGKECFPEVWAERPREAAGAVCFPATPEGHDLWRSGSPLAGQVAEFLQKLERAIRDQLIIPLDPPDDQPAASAEVYLQAQTPAELNRGFFEHMIWPFFAQYQSLNAELPALAQHLQRHLLDRSLVHLGEILKTRTPAWRAFNRAVLEGLHEQVQDLSEGQAEIMQRLEKLAPVRCSEDLADSLADLVAAYGQMEKNLSQGLDGLGRQAMDFHHAEMERLGMLAETSVRIETKVERVLRFLEDGKYVIEGPAPLVVDQWPEPGEAPFKGMQFFDEADAPLFFGRELLAARLANLLDDRPLLAVTGASGSGKSSLVRAGLIPVLRGGKLLANGTFPPTGAERWPVILLTPTAHPFEALAACLTRGSESIREAVMLLDNLKADPRSLELYARRLAGPADSRSKVLLVVDQFEELFTLCRDAEERQAFIDTLLDATSQGADSPLRVVITLRADFYAACAQYPGLREVLSKWQEYIGPMEPQEVRRAIEEPARLGKWDFEPGLVELILHDIGAEGTHPPEPGALPLLSHALLETWKHRRGRTMTLESYAESGGVRKAIAHTAESVYQYRLNLPQQAAARRIFLRLTELGEGTQDTRRRARLEEFITSSADEEDITAVLQVLTDARLVTTAEDSIEVAHEALIREWPTLQRWLEEDRQGIRIQRRLSEAAEEWQRSKNDVGLLYRGARLVEAGEWAAAHKDELNANETRFLEASQALQHSELEQIRQRAEEQARVAARMRQRSIYLGAALLVVALLAVLSVIFWQRAGSSASQAIAQQQTAEAARAEAVQQKNAAEQNRQTAVAQEQVAKLEAHRRATAEALAQSKEAEARKQAEIATGNKLVAQAKLFTGTNHDLALLLSLQANRLLDTPNARLGLFESLDANSNALRYFYYTPNTYADTVAEMAVEPEGRYLAAVSNNLDSPQWVKVWDVATGKLQIETEVNDALQNLYFSDANTLIFASSAAPTIYTLDIKTGKITVRDIHLSGEFKYFLFSPDLATLLTLDSSKKLNVWNSTTQQLVQTISIYVTDDSAALWFVGGLSPNNKYVAVQEAVNSKPSKYRLHLIDLENSREASVFSYTSQEKSITKIAFAAAQPFLLVGNQTAVDLYRTGTMEFVRKFENCTRNYDLYIYDDKSFICNNREGIKFINIQTGQVERVVQGGNQRWGGSLVMNRSHSLGAYALDNAIVLLNLAHGEHGWVAAWHGNPVTGLGFSADSKNLFSASRQGQLSYSNLTTRMNADITIPAADNPANHWPNAIDPTSSFYVEFTADQKMLMWDLRSGKKLAEVETGFDNKDAVVDFSINSKKGWIAAVTYQNKIWVWDYQKQQMVMNITSPVKNPYGEWLNAVEFSPSGDQVAVGVYDIVSVFDVPSGVVRFNTRMLHTNDIMGIAYSPDGKMIASCSSDGTIIFWDAQTGNQIGNTILAHNIITLAFSPDGRTLASGDWDSEEVILWDVQTGLQIGQPLTGHTGRIDQLLFSPDGRYLASADSNGTVFTWDLSSEGLRARACFVANRELNDSEWNQFMSGAERSDACPSSAQADIETGWWLFHHGQYTLAKAQFSSALARDAQAVEANLGRAMAAYWLDDDKATIADFEIVRQNKPDLLDAINWNTFGWAYFRIESFDKSLECFSKAVELYPGDSGGYNGLGWAYYRKEDYPAAIATFEKGLAIEPNGVDLYDGLGHIYYQQGEYAKAIENIEKAISLDKAYAYFLNLVYLGWSNLHLDNLDRAQWYFEQANQADPQAYGPYQGFGDIYYQRKQMAQALENYQKYLELNKDAPADYVVKRVAELKGK